MYWGPRAPEDFRILSYCSAVEPQKCFVDDETYIHMRMSR